MVTQDIVTSEMSRRDMLRRSATLGAALAVSGPVVQSLGRVNAFAQATPPPPPPEEQPPAGFPSNFQVLVGFKGVVYGVKYDEPSWDRIGSGTLCGFSQSFSDPNGPNAGPDGAELLGLLSQPGVVSKVVDSATGKGQYVLHLPSSVTFVEGRAKDGSCQADEDKCGAPVEANPDGSYSFEKCDT